jgi:hypothetical protein
MMKMSTPTVTISSWNTGSRRVPHLPKKSIDDAIDEYAQQLLQRLAGNDYIDDSLGSYVTSCIRSSIGSNESTKNHEVNIVELPEYEPLCELIQEHCQEMDVASITVLLQKIINAIVRRLVPEDDPMSSPSSTTPTDKEPRIVAPSPHVISPYAANALLPENLLTEVVNVGDRTLPYPEEALPYVPPTLIMTPPSSITQRDNVTAAMTRNASPINYDRRLAVEEETAPESLVTTIHHVGPEISATALDPAMRRQKQQEYHALLDRQRLEYQVADRLYRAGGISHAAATAAAQLARGNGPVAQYILHQAAAQVPVCRHLLTGGCYRADCTFSHDIENHTCVFWMKSQCAKVECRFWHGFSESLLEQMPEEYRTLQNEDDDWEDDDDDYDPPVQIPTSQHSFVNIASQGYHQQQSYHDPHPAPPRSRPWKPPTVPIPQQLWQPQRDPSAFGIADPLERYYAVSAAWKERVMTNYVLDLHYQSLQTFPVVLETLLPEQLRAAAADDDGVWIITGTGHHVAERGHQKRNVSTLEGAVWEYLLQNYHPGEGYRIAQGRDRNGQGGALFIQKL